MTPAASPVTPPPAWRDHVILAFVLAVLFLPFLGIAPLFDWDEANFAEAAREMLVSGDFLRVTIGFTPFFEKPPLFFWLQAASMSIFGVNEWAARLPSAVAGVITMSVIFEVGRRAYGRAFGAAWVLAYIGSILPGAYFRTGIIDPTFNLLILLSISSLVAVDAALHAPRDQHPLVPIGKWPAMFLAALFAGLAVLAKGPVGLAVPMIAWGLYWLIWRRSPWPPVIEVLFVVVIAVCVSASWFAVEYARNGSAFASAFLAYQWRLLAVGEAGHGQPIYYHAVATLIGCFPASIVAFLGARSRKDDTATRLALHRWMLVAFCCVMVAFSLVTTKILHYVSFAYIPLAYFAALGVHRIRDRETPLARWYVFTLVGMALLWGAALAAFPFVMMNAASWADRVPNAFTRAVLLVPVHWTILDAAPGAIVVAGAIVTAWLIARGRALAAHLCLFIVFGAAMALLLPLHAPKIHEHTQGAALRYYRLAGENDAYVRTTFRSYAQHFYAGLTPERSAASRQMSVADFETWLRQGLLDKPAYFVTDGRDRDELSTFAVKRSEDGGFALFIRRP